MRKNNITRTNVGRKHYCENINNTHQGSISSDIAITTNATFLPAKSRQKYKNSALHFTTLVQ
jgi:hypothetical protein